MNSGFYQELKGLQKDYPDTTFDFMENISLSPYGNAYQFLHGDCVTFAYVLSKKCSYSIKIRKKNSTKTSCPIIHAWCEYDGKYIDVRGITSSFDEFWMEFEDLDSFDLEDDSISFLHYDNAKDFYNAFGGHMNLESFSYSILKAAYNLYEKYKDYYQVA